MAEIDNKDWSRVGESLSASFSAHLAVEEVFPESAINQKFVQALCALSDSCSQIKLGGRRLRTLLGCEIADFSDVTVRDAESMTNPHQLLRMGPLVEVLKKYPEARMVKPDLDLFVWDSDPAQIQKTLKDHGFDSTLHIATGGVWVVQVEAENGSVTFVDGEQSWQTKEDSPWPKYGIKAPFVKTPEPHFELNTMYGSMYLYPLDIPRVPSVIDNPIEPERVAVVGRVLLWSLTAFDPQGRRLEVPGDNTQKLIYETVYYLYPLIKKIAENPKHEVQFRSGIRDAAIALRVIVLSDWAAAVRELGFSKDQAEFFGLVSSAWYGGMFDALKEENNVGENPKIND